jgi:hypothetical protein
MNALHVSLLSFASSLLLAAMLPVESARGTTVEWSGFKWTVRNDTGGPGPNTFLPQNVTVASDGSLHLQIQQKGSQWTCAELYSNTAMQYGTYQFEIESPIDQLDPNIVFGMFSYPTAKVGPDGTNEIDIEYSQWGDATYPNGNFTVWPTVLADDNAFYTFDFTNAGSTTQRFLWTPGLVQFQTFLGFSTALKNLIADWQTPASFTRLVSNHAMPVHINLWLFNGQPPTNGKPVEVILKSFMFKKA